MIFVVNSLDISSKSNNNNSRFIASRLTPKTACRTYCSQKAYPSFKVRVSEF